MCYSCITTLAIWVYNDKVVLFADISIPNTSISKIIDLIRHVDEWAEISFSARQNSENEHCVTLKKIVHKLNFHYYTCLYNSLNVLFVYYYSCNLCLQCLESCVLRIKKMFYTFFLILYVHFLFFYDHKLRKTCWRMSIYLIFSSPKCLKYTMWKT